MQLLVVEYSIKEEAYHVQTVEEMLCNNLKLVKRKVSKDYLPIHLAISRKEAHKFIDQHRASKNLIYVQQP